MKEETTGRNYLSLLPSFILLPFTWQAGQESNLQPADLEAAALPN